MGLHQPSLVLALENEDASSAMAGILWLKGCNVYTANSAADCLEKMKNLESKVDVVIVSSEIALDRDAVVLTSDPEDIARWGVPAANIITC